MRLEQLVKAAEQKKQAQQELRAALRSSSAVETEKQRAGKSLFAKIAQAKKPPDRPRTAA